MHPDYMRDSGALLERCRRHCVVLHDPFVVLFGRGSRADGVIYRGHDWEWMVVVRQGE